MPSLTAQHFTFGCFNNPLKISPNTIRAWSSILQSVPDSQLLLKYDGYEQADVCDRIRGDFAACGVGPARIRFEPWSSSHRELLAAYHQVDLALDTQPYSGGVTTCEALWMGVPVITFPGRTFAGRHSVSHLTNAGFPQFVASNLVAYIHLAIQWANRREELASLRSRARDQVNRSLLCDAKSFAANFLSLLKSETRSRLEGPDYVAQANVRSP